jgi:hypothetical protein
MTDRTDPGATWEKTYFASIDRASSLALQLIGAEAGLMDALDNGSDGDVDRADAHFHAVRTALQQALQRVEIYNSDTARQQYIEGAYDD